PPVLHAGLPGGGGASAPPGRRPPSLLAAGDVQRANLRRAFAGGPLPSQPRALPARRRAALRPLAPGAPALEAAAGVVPAAIAGGVPARPPPPRRRAGGGDPPDLVRLPAPPRRAGAAPGPGAQRRG